MVALHIILRYPLQIVTEHGFRYVRIQARIGRTHCAAEREVTLLSAGKKISLLHTPRCEKGGNSYECKTP